MVASSTFDSRNRVIGLLRGGGSVRGEGSAMVDCER